MNTSCIKKISGLPKNEKDKRGLNYFRRSADKWQEGLSPLQIPLLLKNNTFKKLLDFAKSLY